MYKNVPSKLKDFSCMKKLILTLILFSQFFIIASAEYVGGYIKRDGTVVRPYNRTMPDNTRVNNYSTSGNINPYNGNKGSVPVTYPIYYKPQTNYNYPTYSQPRLPKFNNKIMPLAGG